MTQIISEIFDCFLNNEWLFHTKLLRNLTLNKLFLSKIIRLVAIFSHLVEIKKIH